MLLKKTEEAARQLESTKINNQGGWVTTVHVLSLWFSKKSFLFKKWETIILSNSLNNLLWSRNQNKLIIFLIHSIFSIEQGSQVRNVDLWSCFVEPIDSGLSQYKFNGWTKLVLTLSGAPRTAGPLDCAETVVLGSPHFLLCS